MAITAIILLMAIICLWPPSSRANAQRTMWTPSLAEPSPVQGTPILSSVLNLPPLLDGTYVTGLPLSGFVYVRPAAAMAPQVLRADAYLSDKEWSRVPYTEARHTKAR